MKNCLLRLFLLLPVWRPTQMSRPALDSLKRPLPVGADAVKQMVGSTFEGQNPGIENASPPCNHKIINTMGMKQFIFTCLLLLPTLVYGQTGDPVLDSLKRPLPANVSPQILAERLESILSYTLDDQYDLPVYGRQLDSLFHCCIQGKTGNLNFERHIESVIPMFQGLALLYKDPEKARTFIESARNKFSFYGDSAGLSLAYVYLGSLASAQGDSLTFAELYPKSLALSRHIKTP